jgi:hypothetical protein
MSVFVGINGPKRVGKDTFAENISSHLKLKFSIIIDRIADPLYKWASSITGLSYAELMGEDKDKIWQEDAPFPNLVGRSPRSLLLDLGNFTRDCYGEDFLVNSLLNKYSDQMFDWDKINKYPIILVPDVRTQVEADSMDILIGLEREGCSFSGGRTESGVSKKSFWKTVKMQEVKNGNMHSACDYKKIAEELTERINQCK